MSIAHRLRRARIFVVLALVASALIVLPAGPAAAAGITETFDDASGFTTSSGLFSDGGGDYLGITGGTTSDFGGGTVPSALKSYTGFTGSYLTGMDLDGEGASLPITIEWTGIDITGLTGIEFSGEFAEFFDTPGDIDAADYLYVETSIDGGPYVKILQFSGADFSSTSGPFNGIFRDDTDFDGTGDGTALGNAAQTFVRAVPGTGTSLDLRLTVSVEAGDEDFAVDNFVIRQAPTCDAIPIADVQGPGASTPLAGTEVTIRGVVTADFGGEIVVQEPAGGPRSGVLVFSSGNSASRGDDVCVTGIASERFGQTQVGGNSNPNATIEILSSGNTLPAPAVVTTDTAGDEQWEGVLVRVETVTVTNPDLGFGEWSVDDGSGPVRVDDVGVPYPATLGEALDYVQGPLYYTFSNYKIEPRDGDDIGVPERPPLSCAADYTFDLIHDVQGSGATTPIPGQEVTLEAVVVGDFQADDGQPGDLAGFYVQEEDGDADTDPVTSEGLFVFDLGSSIDVALGDLVRVRGNAGEFQDQTQVSIAFGGGEVVVCDTGQEGAVTATEVPFPLADGQDSLEQLEGMLVTTPDDMVVIEYFNLDRYGIVDIATERLEQPTDTASPGAAADAVAAYNEARRIRLDDGSQQQNPAPVILPDGELAFSDAFGGGDLLGDIEGPLSWIRPRVGGSPEGYAIQLNGLPTFTDTNQRPATAPSVGGRLTAAGFNVLNYFNGDGLGGGFPTPRGATDAAELMKQTDKIVSAITGFDADVVGLVEIENDFADGDLSAVADLVDALNAVSGAGTYEWIDPGANVGPDAIAVALIYQPDVVSPLGSPAILDDLSFLDPLSTGTDRNRAAIAQTFLENDTGEVFTAVVNHFKSKGSACGPDDDDPQQGNCNGTRTAAAEALVAWLDGAPTGWSDPDVLLLGDYNAYAMEDPIVALEDAGYADLLEALQPDDVYTYVFDGQTGYLDYGLASASLVGQVTGAAPWNINSDEPDAFEYDEAFDDPANLALWYDPSAYASSDHDPVLVGLDLDGIDDDVTASPDELWPPNHKYRTITVSGTSPDGDLAVVISDVTSSEIDCCLGRDDLPNDIVILGDAVVNLRAERYAREGRVYTIEVWITDIAGQNELTSVVVDVPHDRRMR